MKLTKHNQICIFVILIGVVIHHIPIVLGDDAEELADFDFTSQNDDDTEPTHNDDYYSETEEPPVDSFDRIDTDFDLFDDGDEFNYDDKLISFAEKEQRLKSIMLKVLANAELKRKFSEVIPMIRVMSSTQRSTLAHLITAQVNAKPGRELTLDQVKQMFGDRPALILPLIFDIANMIRSAAQKEKFLESDIYQEDEKVPNDQYLRRSFTLSKKPQGFRKVGEDYDDYGDDTVGTIRVPAPPSFLKDDRLIVKETVKVTGEPDEVAEALPVPEALVIAAPRGRSLRSRFQPYFDRFVQSLPPIQNMKMPADAMTYHEKMLNMSAYNGTTDQIAMPSDGPVPVTIKMNDDINYSNLTLDEIENLAFSNVNGTEDEFPINDTMLTSENDAMPQAEKLISLQLRPIGGNRIRNKANNKVIIPQRKQSQEAPCERFTKGLCLSVEKYPTSLIMSSIRRNKHAMKALLAEFKDKYGDGEDEDEDGYSSNSVSKRREDMTSPNGMCPSIIRYARPQKARSATGEWKYIVNTGQHTQTLRLEKCSNPQDTCSFLTDNYRSRCIQIFNYHRLLSWDQTRGLHVDIFKVPTCCSCHIDGYREAFPPLTSAKSPKTPVRDDFDDEYRFSESIISQTKHKPRQKPPSKYSTLNLNMESIEGDEDENIAMQFSNGFQRKPKPFKYEATSFEDPPPVKKQRFDVTKLSKNPYATKNLETYLSPPEYDSVFSFKRGQLSQKPDHSRNKYEDQYLAGSDINTSEIAVSPPLTPSEYDKIYGKHRGTASGEQSSSEQKLTNLKLPNTATYEVNGKRVNYNYHPILDFFNEKSDTAKTTNDQVVARRRAQTVSRSTQPLPAKVTQVPALGLWQPMVNGRPRLS